MKGQQNTLYHGTCRAFIEFANQRSGQFGPDNSDIYFTPNYSHATAFADSWKTHEGRNRLESLFGELPEKYHEGVIITFDKKTLGKLKKGFDGATIQYTKQGPINIQNTNTQSTERRSKKNE